MAFKLADEPDDLSQELGVNTLWLEDGRLKATNTDGGSCTANLDERHPGWDKGALGGHPPVRAAPAVPSSRPFAIAASESTSSIAVARAVELADRFGEAVHPHRWRLFQK